MRLASTLLLLSTISMAAATDQAKWQGTWAATVGTSGTTFTGTWNAVSGETADTVTGTWSLLDQKGAELANGTWAAGKEGKFWKGNWQARRPSGQVYSGTWRAQVDIPANSHFSELFEAAMTKAVSGTWQTGSVHAGAWTVRAYAQK